MITNSQVLSENKQMEKRCDVQTLVQNTRTASENESCIDNDEKQKKGIEKK